MKKVYAVVLGYDHQDYFDCEYGRSVQDYNTVGVFNTKEEAEKVKNDLAKTLPHSDPIKDSCNQMYLFIEEFDFAENENDARQIIANTIAKANDIYEEDDDNEEDE